MGSQLQEIQTLAGLHIAAIDDDRISCQEGGSGERDTITP